MKLTLEEKIERLWDAQEIAKVMTRYAFLHNANEHAKTAALFALDREDIWIECGGIGIYKGAAGIKKFFIDWHDSLTGADARGAFNEHLLTTPLIEVAHDGQTAKAVCRPAPKRGGFPPGARRWQPCGSGVNTRWTSSKSAKTGNSGISRSHWICSAITTIPGWNASDELRLTFTTTDCRRLMPPIPFKATDTLWIKS
jgi:hypothetical protein